MTGFVALRKIIKQKENSIGKWVGIDIFRKRHYNINNRISNAKKMEWWIYEKNEENVGWGTL